MNEIKLTPSQINDLRGYVSRGDTYGGWKYLDNLGDRYADNAAGIIGSDDSLNGLDLWMKKSVENLWDLTVGREVRLQQFDKVASQHFKQYVETIVDNHGYLPSTAQIEKSYHKAVTENGVSSSAAIDLVINRVGPDGYWALGLGIENERIDNKNGLGNPNGRHWTMRVCWHPH